MSTEQDGLLNDPKRKLQRGKVDHIYLYDRVFICLNIFIFTCMFIFIFVILLNIHISIYLTWSPKQGAWGKLLEAESKAVSSFLMDGKAYTTWGSALHSLSILSSDLGK